MHFLYFVYLDKEQKITTSKKAREVAERTLLDNDFASEGGFFSGAKADWFVVGGRWSSVLTEALGKKPKPKMERRDCSESYPDSAMIFNSELLKAVQKKSGETKYIRKAEVFCPERMEEIRISDLNKTDIGGWLVVVDYHI